MDFQLELQNKTDMIRNKCYNLARDLLAEGNYKNVHREDSNQLDSSTKKEEQPSHDNMPNASNGTSILIGNGETEVSYGVVYTSPFDEHIDGPGRRVDQTANVGNSPSYLDMENTNILFGDMEINLDEFYGDTRLEIMSNIEEEQMDRNVGRIDDLAHVELEDISKNVVPLGDEKLENSMENSPLVFEADCQKPLSLDLLDMFLVKEDKLV